MNLSNLEKAKLNKKAKRIGRGESSGKGKTSGKGYKGQNVRGKVRLGFEGGQLPIIKRLPFKKGIGNDLAKEKITLTLDHLKIFDSGETVDTASLLKKGLLPKTSKAYSVKIVATGKIEKALKVNLPTTNESKKLIEKAGGSVVFEKASNKKEEVVNA